MRRWEEELEGYFAGRLESAMGLRSWLGPWGDRKSPQGSRSTGSAPEPGGLALAAARETNRVEGALALCGERHARVLEARYTPRGPHAPLQSYGDVAGVVLVLEADVARVLAWEDEAELRRALRTGRAGDARMALEAYAGAEGLGVPERLLALEVAAGGARGHARRARQVRAALRRVAGHAVAAAAEAYLDARDRWVRHERAGRLERYRASLEGR